MAYITTFITRAVVVVIIANALSHFEIYTLLADMLEFESLDNATVPFLQSLHCTSVTWYSYILSLLLWCQLAIYGMGFIRNIRHAGRTICALCCTTAHLFVRCVLTGAGLLMIFVLHSFYDSTFPDLW